MPVATKATAGGATSKRKVSVSLDDELVSYLEGHDEPLSVQVNAAVHAEVERRRHQVALARFCDEYVQANGPWTDEDEAEIQRIMQLLGG
jgi:hypothetical protein